MTDHPTPTAEEARLLRGLAGIGIMDAKAVLALSRTEPFEGDVNLAFHYHDASALAVHVKGDRHAWQMARARSRAEADRETGTPLGEAFPLPGTASRPGP